MPSESYKRIIQNTGFLYMRMLLTMAISFYTTRIVLEQLGVHDYGIYNVVGGLVSIFSILSASLSSSISRFLTFELGKGNMQKMKVIFSSSIFIQLGLSIIVIFFLETVGVWFLNTKMNIAPARMTAANWVLQCSAITFAINMLSVPYNAAIIAYERMQAFAYIGLLEVSLKLAVAFMLFIPFFDSLILYALLLVLASGIVRLTYSLYCKKHFDTCRVEFKFNKNILKEMFSYSGWTFIGSSSAILRDQGVNIVMNIFCGTAINAARGVAMQINGAITSFSHNYMLAVNPQIIKSYAIGNVSETIQLAFRSSRFSFFLLYCLSLPILIVMPFILSIWLTETPDHTVSFSRIILFFGMSEALSTPFMYVNQATGKIKVYQLVVGGIQMLNLPLAYMLLKIGLNSNWVFIQSIILSQLGLFSRLIILSKNVGLSISKFLSQVYLKVIIVLTIGVVFSFILTEIIPTNNFFNNILLGALSFLIGVLSSYLFGCTRGEKNFIMEKIHTVTKKIKR